MQSPNFNFLIWKLFMILIVSVYFTSSFDLSQLFDDVEESEELETSTLMSIYFFNWTNPEDINNPNIKPRFQEVGPYKYKKIQRERYNELLNYYYFDEESFPYHESDVITTINPVSLAIASIAKQSDLLQQIALERILRASDPAISIRKTVRELTFEGYNDPMLDLIFKYTNKRFGWFYGKNKSVNTEEYYIADTYEDVKHWLFRDTSYSSEDLQKLLGSSDIQFSFPETCNPLRLYYMPKVFSDDDNDEYRYSVGITDTEDRGPLQCDERFPVYTSLPHFFQSPFFYFDAVEGLSYLDDNRETFIVINKETGLVKECVTRVQLNLLLQPTRDVQLYASVPEVMIPVFWVENILSES